MSTCGAQQWSSDARYTVTVKEQAGHWRQPRRRFHGQVLGELPHVGIDEHLLAALHSPSAHVPAPGRVHPIPHFQQPDHLVLRYRLADLHGVPAWQLHIPIAVNIRSGSLWTAVVYNTNVYLEPTVTRTQIYLTSEQRDSLANQSARTGRPMSELIREALDQYLRRHRQERRQEVLRSVAGLWADRTDLTQSDDARATLDRDLSP